MASVSIYLNFQNETEAAFSFYKQVFGGEFAGEGIMKMKDAPPMEGMPPLSEEEKELVMHVSLPILNEFMLMGSDVPQSMGLQVTKGSNYHINLITDSRAQNEELFNKLSEGGKVTMPLHDAFWGDYFGSCTDKFGINWMMAYPNK